MLPWCEFISVFIFLICLPNWKYVNDVGRSEVGIIGLLTFGFLAGHCGLIVRTHNAIYDECGLIGFIMEVHLGLKSKKSKNKLNIEKFIKKYILPVAEIKGSE